MKRFQAGSRHLKWRGIAAAQTIKLGSVLSLTSGPSAHRRGQRLTVELLTKEINACGVIDGRKVGMILYDDTSEATKALSREYA